MRLLLVLLCPVLCFAGTVFPASAQELNAKFSFSLAHHDRKSGTDGHAALPLLPGTHARTRSDLELRLRWRGVSAQSTLRLASGENGSAAAFESDINQLYYDGKLENGLDWSLGKKVTTWGVGFGFRPLDVIQREDRRAHNPPALVGLPLLALEHFSENGALTLAWINPATQKNHAGDRKDEALALRYFRFAEQHDLHLVARLSRTRKLEFGLGATHVVNDGLSLHGAALYAQRYPVTINRLLREGELFAAADPMRRVLRKHGARAVAGLQWTGESGWSVLAEAHYDGEAYAGKDWRRLFALTRAQTAHAALFPATPAGGGIVAANVAWSAQAYRQPGLIRENLLLRFAHDDGHGFKPYLELFAAPRDRGVVLTAGFEQTRNRHRFLAGFRHFSGPTDSVYANVPEQNIAWLRWELAF
ncbi:MAG: hypothetical protein LBO00_04925 [Zoogloeaceae bacterium]|jgi:hypothetical protein|nr:hypothetical protein [Zoogloeaceae bacterium]